MLEQKIEALTIAIVELTRVVAETQVKAAARIDEVVKSMTQALIPDETQVEPPVKPAREAKATKTTKPASEPTPQPDPVPEQETPAMSSVTRKDLMDISLSLVRADGSLKAEVIAILEKHGAKTISTLEADKLHSVHAALMAISYRLAKTGK